MPHLPFVLAIMLCAAPAAAQDQPTTNRLQGNQPAAPTTNNLQNPTPREPTTTNLATQPTARTPTSTGLQEQGDAKQLNGKQSPAK